EDAHMGKGLGLQFLRHIERNSLLLFVVSAFSDVRYEYEALLHEVEAYRNDLLEKPRILAVNKLDAVPDFDLAELADLKIPVIGISAVSGQNLTELKEQVWKELITLRRAPLEAGPFKP
ncbi:GTPase ObgE, partial [Arthrospira platensis SPKY1]|nr:GTPase ObgE [Arthrospira platensis SPKY1]